MSQHLPSGVPDATSVVGDDVRYFIDGDGRQHFNFMQQIWLDTAVQMAYTRTPTLALETLAVNLLTMVMTERNCRVAVGITSRRALALSAAFCEECLLNAPEGAWVLPRQSVRAWVASHRRIRTLHRASHRSLVKKNSK